LIEDALDKARPERFRPTGNNG